MAMIRQTKQPNELQSAPQPLIMLCYTRLIDSRVQVSCPLLTVHPKYYQAGQQPGGAWWLISACALLHPPALNGEAMHDAALRPAPCGARMGRRLGVPIKDEQHRKDKACIRQYDLPHVKTFQFAAVAPCMIVAPHAKKYESKLNMWAKQHRPLINHNPLPVRISESSNRKSFAVLSW